MVARRSDKRTRQILKWKTIRSELHMPPRLRKIKIPLHRYLQCMK